MAKANAKNIRRKCIVQELFTTEQTYVQSLEQCLAVFYRPLMCEGQSSNLNLNNVLEHGCTIAQAQQIFSTLPRIYEDTSLLLRVLAQQKEKFDNSTLLAQVLLQYFFETALPNLYEVFPPSFLFLL